VHRQRQKKHAAELEMAEYRNRNEILNIRLEVEERTVNLISYEIHDNINQVLGIVRMQLLNAMRQESKKTADVIIEESCGRLKYAVTQLRELSHILSSKAVGKMGLVNMVQKELAYIKSTTMLECSFHCSEEELPLGPEQELLVARITQESFHNIIRHSRATAIDVGIDIGEKFITISITDNGIGMDIEQLPDNEGVGFTNLRARLELLHGSMEIKSGKGKGTTLVFTVPVE
jgi:signal transduction histidine kinase